VRIGNQPPHGSAGDRSPWTRWRAERLRSAGFSGDVAEWLAGEERVDLHEVLELVDRGCPPHLAARILAPLEQASGQS
jgi:hypothetical protein